MFTHTDVDVWVRKQDSFDPGVVPIQSCSQVLELDDMAPI